MNVTMPTERTREIQGKTATLFRDGTPPVYILPDGMFAAFYQSRWLVKPSIRQLDGAMTRIPNPVKVLAVDVFGSSPMFYTQAVTVTAFEGYRKNRDESGKVQYGAYESDYYLHDAGIVAKLDDLTARRKAAEDAFREELKSIMDAARPVRRHNLEAVQRGEVPPTQAEIDAARRKSDAMESDDEIVSDSP